LIVFSSCLLEVLGLRAHDEVLPRRFERFSLRPMLSDELEDFVNGRAERIVDEDLLFRLSERFPLQPVHPEERAPKLVTPVVFVLVMIQKNSQKTTVAPATMLFSVLLASKTFKRNHLQKTC
jgi:hypothetical protein